VNASAGVKPRYRRFAGTECKGERRRRLEGAVELAGPSRELTASSPAGATLRFLLGRTRFSHGRRRDELRAVAHPHAGELTWL